MKALVELMKALIELRSAEVNGRLRHVVQTPARAGQYSYDLPSLKNNVRTEQASTVLRKCSMCTAAK